MSECKHDMTKGYISDYPFIYCHECGATDEEIKLKSELSKAREELQDVSDAIGTTEYMDPPDGGSPSLAEQVSRMKQDLAKCREELEDLKAIAMRGFNSQFGTESHFKAYEDFRKYFIERDKAEEKEA